MGFSREEYWSGLSLAPPGDLSDPGMGAVSLASPALAGGFFTASAAIAILNTKVIKEREKERERSHFWATVLDIWDQGLPHPLGT